MRAHYIGSNKCSRCGGNDPNCSVCHEPDRDSEKEINHPQKKSLHEDSNSLRYPPNAKHHAERSNTKQQTD